MPDLRTQRRGELLDLLVVYVPDVLARAGLGNDATLFAALLGHDALSEIGYRTALLPCAVGVYNRDGVAARERGLAPADSSWPARAYERTAYHLLVTVDGVAAVDLTAAQWAARDVPARAGWFETHQRFLEGAEPLHVELELGARLAYRAVTDRRWTQGERKIARSERRRIRKMSQQVAVHLLRRHRGAT